MAAITGQLYDYTVNTGAILVTGGENRDMHVPNTVRRIIRRPDTALRPQFSSAGDNPVVPRQDMELR